MNQINHSDKAYKIYGRKQDFEVINERIPGDGITVISGRPKIGKTTFLKQIAWENQNDYLIGYIEVIETEENALLLIIADLIESYISQAGLKTKFIRAITKSKDAGPLQYIRRSLEVMSTAGVLDQGIAALGASLTIISNLIELFQELPSNQQNESRSEQYKIYQKIVEELSSKANKRVLLVIDSWEKSSNKKFEYGFIERIANSPWLNLHLILGVRALDTPNERETICKLRQLEKGNPGKIFNYELPQMHLGTRKAKNEVLNYIEQKHPKIYPSLEKAELIKLLDGYPGVLDAWCNPKNIKNIHSIDDFKKYAEAAQQYRYLDVENIYKTLSTEQKKFLIKRTIIPSGMNEGAWDYIKDLYLTEGNLDVFDELVDLGLLENKLFPIFDHDTRHSAIRSSCKTNLRLYSSVSRKFIVSLAEKIVDLSDFQHPNIQLLRYLFNTMETDIINDKVSICILHSAMTWNTNYKYEKSPILSDEFFSTANQLMNENKKLVPLLSSGLYNREHNLFMKQIPSFNIKLLESLSDKPHVPDEIKASSRLMIANVNNYNSGKPNIPNNIRMELRSAAYEAARSIFELQDVSNKIQAHGKFQLALYQVNNGMEAAAANNIIDAIELLPTKIINNLAEEYCNQYPQIKANENFIRRSQKLLKL